MTNLRDKKLTDEYSIFLKNLEKERKETSGFARFLIVLVMIVCIIALCILLLAGNENLIKTVFGEDSAIGTFLVSLTNQNKVRSDFSMPFLPRKQNILLLGIDSNGDNTDLFKGTRTDTIIILNVDPKTKSINAISIPRDSKVYLPDDYGIQKINAAHAIGGVEMTRTTLENTLGIRINKYVVVHDEAVKRIVDAIGGVPVYVEKNMFYNDYAGKLHVNLAKGLNVLDGTNAVAYLRFRKDGLGDIGRTQRQQWFLRSLLEKLQTPRAITKIPDILNVVNMYVKTDLSLYEISQYAAMTKNFDINKIEVATLPGAPNQKGAISYWILDPEKTQDMVNRLIYRDTQTDYDKIYTAGVMYSRHKEKEAAEIKSVLGALGYKVNCYGSAQFLHSQFVAHSDSVSNEFYNRLKRKISYLDNVQFVYDPLKNYCPHSDFTIILADN